MTIVELFFALHVTDFTVPERAQIEASIKKIQQCNTMSVPDADCSNALQKYLQMKAKIGGSYGDIQ